MTAASLLAPLLLLSTSALLAVGAGCFRRDPIVITSDDPGSKIPAIKIAARARDTSTAKQLVKDLASDDPAVRFYAIRGLQDLTGETFGYLYYGSDDARKPALKRWRQWLSGADADAVAQGEQDQGTPADAESVGESDGESNEGESADANPPIPEPGRASEQGDEAGGELAEPKGGDGGRADEFPEDGLAGGDGAAE